MSLLQNQTLQRLVGGTVLERLGIGAISRLQLSLLSNHKCADTVQLIRSVRRQRKSLVMANEAFLLHSLATAQRSVPGDYAEVGVFEGGTAKVIATAKGVKTLRLFDTFEGLPESGAVDGGVHRHQQYACNLESVKDYLRDYEHVEYYPGLFPDSTHDVPEARYALAHFDVDLYESTRGCLEYFYPRMEVGGIIISHDYSVLAGVKQAFDEFLADKPEALIELPTTQCMLVRLPEFTG